MDRKPSVPYELEKEDTTIFKSTEREVYRIPALFYNRDNQTLMAFAEKRRTPDDTSTVALVRKTGILNKDERTIKWSNLNLVKEAHLDGYRPMNPCPVYEKTSKTLFLFFICVEGTVPEQHQIRLGCNKTRLCYVTTTDAGQSWSNVTDLTDSLVEIKHWATFAVGPGHGLQTESGRLIVPVYAYASCRHSLFSTIRMPHALVLYSDDKGNTWHFGKMFQNESIECEMAEVFNETDSFIYCNARSKGGYREEAVSANNGDDFSKLSGAKKLVETGSGCQGSVVSFPDQSKAEHADSDQSQSLNKWLLFSHPTNKSKRIDLGVYLNKSPGNPNAWSKPWIINRGPSGYSDLAYVDDGLFVCLMECGKQKETEQIAFKVFSYTEVEQGNGE